MSNKKSFNNGIVYSTNPEYKTPEPEEDPGKQLSPAEQKIRVKLETKHRAGKAVTLLEGFYGTDEEKEMIGKKLKSYCGTGGSVKDGDILVQGDNRDKVLQWLLKNGYKNSKKV